MYMTGMVSKTYIIGKVSRLLFVILILGLLYSCNSTNKEDGFLLDEFVIDDNGLNSIVDSIIEMYQPILESEDQKQIMTLNLSHKDSVLLFIFSLRDENELLNRYIYRNNKRIVGYTKTGDEEIIVLSDIDYLPELGNLFGRFIHPIGKSKAFKYMKYPHNLYMGDGQNVWPSFELIYDPTYIVYPYINKKYQHPIMTKNPELEIYQY